MTTATTPAVQLQRIINLKNYEDALGCITKSKPALVANRQARLDAARVHFEKYAEVKAAAKKHGYILNAYPLRTKEGTMEPMTVWIRMVDGKMVSYSRFEPLISKLGVDLSNLPAIPEVLGCDDVRE